VVACWIRGGWRHAAAVGYAIFLILAAVYHIIDAIGNHNLSAGNVGPVLWSDVGVGCILLVLTFVEMRSTRPAASKGSAGAARRSQDLDTLSR
ncbi:MAG: DUF6790 family protein, partial [Candidatus Dormibacteraceae bacterium]